MRLRRNEYWQLCTVIAAAFGFVLLLRTQSFLGQDVSANTLARSVREDQSSPTERSPAADLTLIVFTDYRCPACRAAHPAMKQAARSDGKVEIVYKDWPIFGEASARAARIAIASSFQDIYPLVHDRLMTGPTNGEAALRASIERSGGDWRRVEVDLVNRRSEIQAQLTRNGRQAYGLGLRGTPGYLIGPILVRGALTKSEFVRIFRKARAAESKRRNGFRT